MWRQDVSERGWALDYCEDTGLPPASRRVRGPQALRRADHRSMAAKNALLVPDPDTIWSGYQARPIPYLQHRFVAPVRFSTYCAPGEGAAEVGEVSRYCEEETLVPVRQNVEFDLDAVNAHVGGENAYTFDLGSEYIGYCEFEIDAPEGRILDVSWAELLLEGRPSILRKGTRFSLRYHTGAGRAAFSTIFRLERIPVSASGDSRRRGRCHDPPCRLPRTLRSSPPGSQCQSSDKTRRCNRSLRCAAARLEVGVQDSISIDCPTREQAQYWGDALFIAQSLWQGFQEPRYLEWYLDCFLHVPFNVAGQISSVYPGEHAVFLDYSLIPLLGQRLFQQNTGHFYKVQESCESVGLKSLVRRAEE